MDRKGHESEGLLKNEDLEINTSDDSECPNCSPRSSKRLTLRIIMIHISVAALYLIVITALLKATLPARLPNLIYVPARNALQYQVTEMYTREDNPNPFMGMTDASDEAWHSLMEHTNFRLTDEDLQRLNRTSVALGSGGYLGMPTVFHELHCLKMIRWSSNLTRYGHWFGVRDHEELQTHVDHCMDVVRQSIMCRADMSPMTFYWTLKSRVPETDFAADHECVDWTKVEQWLEERRVDIYGVGELNHPVYGASYPNGHRLIEDWNVPKKLPFVPLPSSQRLKV